MRNRKIKFIIIFQLLILGLILGLTKKESTVQAKITSDGIPYETLTLGTGNRLVSTQTAYVPYGLLNQKDDVSLNGPRDMYFYNDDLYIADTGNKRVVIVKNDGTYIDEFTHSSFSEITGIFVSDLGIYIADKGARKVYKFSLDHNLEETYERPTEVMFGKNTPFVPTKIVVADSGLMYITGEGSNNGVITINKFGEFMGFVGINTTTFSLRKYLYNFFVNNASLAGQKPSAPTNLTIGNNGNIFTTNVNINETFKRLNISGSNTLDGDTYYPTEEISDIAISDDSYIYISTVDGKIYEFDNNGKLLFKFDTLDRGNLNVLGLTSEIASIEVDSNGNLFVLDNKNNNIQMYQKTAFVSILHKAVDMYNDGKYLQSKDLWETVLKENNNFALAHTALGFAYYKEDDYNSAIEEFYLAKNFSGYSQVYWEIRNEFLQKNTGWLLLILVLLIVIIKVAKMLLYRNAIVLDTGKKMPILFHNIQQKYNSKEHNIVMQRTVRTLKEMKYSVRMIRHPQDTCYGLKKQGKASYLSAIVIFMLFIITYMLRQYATAFLFKNHGNVGGAIINLLIILAILFLWCLVNYLVSTLNDGEGWFKDIFISTCYCLIPYILINIPMIFVSYCLTYQEQFIFNIANIVTYLWCGILLFMSIINIHNYTFKETIKNILITLFGMALIALTIFLVYMFMAQLVDFIISVIKEAITHA